MMRDEVTKIGRDQEGLADCGKGFVFTLGMLGSFRKVLIRGVTEFECSF